MLVGQRLGGLLEGGVGLPWLQHRQVKAAATQQLELIQNINKKQQSFQTVYAISNALLNLTTWMGIELTHRDVRVGWEPQGNIGQGGRGVEIERT